MLLCSSGVIQVGFWRQTYPYRRQTYAVRFQPIETQQIGCLFAPEIKQQIINYKNRDMEIVTVEASAFEAMMVGFETFAERMETLCRTHGDKGVKKWLDNQEVCQLLSISKRTLQTYRDNGTLPYSQIGHKMFYKPDDVERVLTGLKTGIK